MVISKYSFPNPNNGNRYDLSQDELIEILDKVYQAGWDQAREIYDPAKQPIVTTSASYWREICTNE